MIVSSEIDWRSIDDWFQRIQDHSTGLIEINRTVSDWIDWNQLRTEWSLIKLPHIALTIISLVYFTKCNCISRNVIVFHTSRLKCIVFWKRQVKFLLDQIQEEWRLVSTGEERKILKSYASKSREFATVYIGMINVIKFITNTPDVTLISFQSLWFTWLHASL